MGRRRHQTQTIVSLHLRQARMPLTIRLPSQQYPRTARRRPFEAERLFALTESEGTRVPRPSGNARFLRAVGTVTFATAEHKTKSPTHEGFD